MLAATVGVVAAAFAAVVDAKGVVNSADVVSAIGVVKTAGVKDVVSAIGVVNLADVVSAGGEAEGVTNTAEVSGTTVGVVSNVVVV